MIDGDGHACLTDIGLTSIVHGGNSSVSLQGPNMINTTAWAAPEVLAGAPVSKEGDIFTFAMVAVEVCTRRVFGRNAGFLTSPVLGQIFTGHPPFLMNFQAAILEILNGGRPKRPETLHHEGLWEVITRSWAKAPNERPTAFELLEFFQES